jgi:hypothetical protein
MFQAPWSPSLLSEINGDEAQLKPFFTNYTTPVFWTTSLSMMVTGSMTSKLDARWLVADHVQLLFCNSQCTVAGLFWFLLVDLLLTRSNDQVRALIHPDRGCPAVELAGGPRRAAL